MTPAAIVLAGGASTRFGGDKLAAQLDGQTVLARSVAVARAVAGEVLVVLGPDDPDPGIHGARVARDPIAHAGPLAGVVTGLGALHDRGTALVLAGDMPRVRPPVLGLLVAAIEDDDDVAAAHLEADPVATLPLAVRPSVVLAAARRLLGEDRRSLRALLDALPAVVVPSATWRAVDPEAETLLDIDVPEDLAR